MMEMKITVAVPDLAAAIAKLAEAMHVTLPAPAPVQAPTPPPAAPVAPPAPAVPVNPTPAPVAAPAAPTAPPPTEAPAAVPTTAPTYTLDHISRAGASLVDAGKMEPLLALLGKYQVQAITQLKPEQYGAFATELRALGAQI